MAWQHVAFWVMLTFVSLFTPKGILSMPGKPELYSMCKASGDCPGFPPSRKAKSGGSQEPRRLRPG